MSEGELVGDKTLLSLTGKFPDILDFYKRSGVWNYSFARCGFEAPVGSKGYFSSKANTKEGQRE